LVDIINKCVFTFKVRKYENIYAVCFTGFCNTTYKRSGYNNFIALTTFIGGAWSAGGKLKESGYSHWLSPNSNATNETGFAALPAGWITFNGLSNGLTVDGFWWTSTDFRDGFGREWQMTYNSRDAGRYSQSEIMGFSVRLVRD